MLRNFLLITTACFALSASVAHAQTTIGGSTVPPPVQYIVSPETPGPNEFVHIQVEGVGQFLGDSKITWKQNGIVVPSAANQTSFSFTTGGVGNATRIDLTIDSSSEGLITRQFIFNPSVINVVWEADTYAPRLYQGKTLYTAGSYLKVVAFPTVLLGKSLVPASQLSFQWYRNETKDTTASGLGRYIYSFQGDQLQNGEQIAVDVYSGATKVGRGEVFIPASEPQVVFYPLDPLRGELLGSGYYGAAALGKTETTLKAEPYFFSNQSVRDGSLTYEWSLNGQQVTGPNSAKGELTVRQTGTGAGRAQIDISVQNTNTRQFVQSAGTTLQLVFGEEAGSALLNFFGL